jgi:flagellar basal body-associated protein FliL
MSEQAKEAAPEGKKKKGKLPMIIILAVVLGGGGFFGMKMRGGGPKKEPEIKLGAVVEIKDEFLTNMAERNSYVRAKISLQLKDGFEATKLEKDLAPIQDAINMKFQATSVRSVATLDGMRKLKKELAAEINKLLAEHEEKKEEKSGEKSDKDSKKDKKEHKEEKAEVPDGWDSAKGPVLKVLFVSWATQ